MKDSHQKNQDLIDRFNREFPIGSKVEIRLNNTRKKTFMVTRPAQFAYGKFPVCVVEYNHQMYSLDKVVAFEPKVKS